MKKIALIAIISIFLTVFALITAAVIISFTVVNPATASINKNLVKKFAKVVRIPEGILPPAYGFDETSYFWEMETIEGEVTGVRFRYTPSFAKNQKEIEAILEMPEGSDASIFNKVLSAVIADTQSLKAVQDIEKADLSASPTAGYQRIRLAIKPETKQAIKIIWSFNKSELSQDFKGDYLRLARYPTFVLKILYGLPNLVVGLFSG